MVYRLYNTKTEEYESSNSQSIWLRRSHIISMLRTAERFKYLPNWNHLVIEEFTTEHLKSYSSQYYKEKKT